MMNKQLKGSAATLAFVALLSAGCGQGMVGAGLGPSKNTGQGATDISMDKIETHMADAESAMGEAQKTLDQLVVNGQISVPSNGVLKTADFTSQSLTGIAEKLKIALDLLYEKISVPVQAAKLAISQARAQIASSIALLNPADPNQAAMISKLQEMMAKLDSFDGRISGIYKTLASKVDILVGKLDGLIGRLDMSNPIMIIPIMELQSIRQVIVDFRDKLANT